MVSLLEGFAWKSQWIQKNDSFRVFIETNSFCSLFIVPLADERQMISLFRIDGLPSFYIAFTLVLHVSCSLSCFSFVNIQPKPNTPIAIKMWEKRRLRSNTDSSPIPKIIIILNNIIPIPCSCLFKVIAPYFTIRNGSHIYFYSLHR